MEAEQGYCLLTYTCGCAAVTPSTDGSDEKLESKREPFQFGRHRIVEGESLGQDCDDPSCRAKAGLEARKREVHRLIRQIECRFREYPISYVKLGQRYHSCLLRTRVRLSDSKQCALAHEQFAISTTPRQEDLFFQLDDKVQKLLSAARLAVQDRPDVDIVKLAMEAVNKALLLSCRKADMMLSLRVGVNAIVAAEREEYGPLTPKGEMKSRSLPSKEIAAAKQQPAILPLPRKLSLPKGGLFDRKRSSCILPRRLNTPTSPVNACVATKARPTGPAARVSSPKIAKLPRHPDYAWPVHRWSMYSPRGLVNRDTSPIKSRKLSARAGPQRNSERERLFQKIIYGRWMSRVKGPRYGFEDIPDMYAIWPLYQI